MRKKIEELDSDDTFVIKAQHLKGVVFQGVLDESREQFANQVSDYRAKEEEIAAQLSDYRVREEELAAQLSASQRGRAQLDAELVTAVAGMHGLTALEARALALRKGIERACGTSENVRQAISDLYIPGNYRDAHGSMVNFRRLKATVHDALTVCNALIHNLKSGHTVEDDLTQAQKCSLKAAEHLIFDPVHGMGLRL